MPERAWVAAPGVDPAPPAEPSPAGARLLCLAAVTAGKGHDVLLTALETLVDLDWQLTCAGAVDVEPGFVAGLREHVQRSGLGDRVELTGPLADAEVAGALAATDLLVSASRHEAYGMAVSEALARAVPVVVTDVGGHPEAVGAGGVLVPPDDPDRLAAALRRWLTEPAERERLRSAAARRRTELLPWSATARRIAEVVDALNPVGPWPVSPVTTRPRTRP
nr:glycosyltransferase family 4 protein [Nocardioides thalensis]